MFLLIGDVTGHGVAAAIVTGVAKAACDLARSLRKEHLRCDEMLRMMNTSIHGADKQRLLMTCVAAVIDPRSRTLTVANAGHSFPYVVRTTNGETKCTPIIVHGAPLGAGADSIYQETQIDLLPNDVLFWHTDGVTEFENDRHEQFTDRRLRAVLEHAARWDPPAIRDTLLHALSRFGGRTPATDDVTFVVARIGDFGVT
jgi:serine phosphatase RsbU (regulator of sigma subunit)